MYAFHWSGLARLGTWAGGTSTKSTLHTVAPSGNVAPAKAAAGSSAFQTWPSV